MEPKEHKTTLRGIFISGLLILIPVAATIFIFVFLFNLLDGWLAPMGGEVLRSFGFKIPPQYKHIPGFGIVATLLLVMITGLVASNYLGRKILQFFNHIISNIPVVSSIYSAIRQVVNSISMTGSKAFQTVVLFEYPRRGIWSIGFLTTPSLVSAKKFTGQDLVNVFLPTTPNPTSGFFLMIPRKSLKVLPISPEDGLKIVATVGLIQREKAIAAPAGQPAGFLPEAAAGIQISGTIQPAQEIQAVRTRARHKPKKKK
ncbi:DUF502 domain-containing protein [candidate division FCPU426 bacterium]|nr:DUF502 domain-containing protein [candidate division FCPU426 bacterium]